MRDPAGGINPKTIIQILWPFWLTDQLIFTLSFIQNLNISTGGSNGWLREEKLTVFMWMLEIEKEQVNLK